MTDPAVLHPAVLTWFEAHARDLPWRRPERTPWGVLVSEVMLQQTPVARVLPVWEEWLRRWPRPADLAGEPAGEAVRAWGRLGYPRRALRLHTAAGVITERHDGQVPRDPAQLLGLPGVGAYTAAAVGAFAFGTREAVLDTNVRRVLSRALGGQEHPGPSPTVAETVRARAALPPERDRAARWNAAVMELGALVCTARSPACDRCPVSGHCAWLASGRPAHEGPPRRGQAWNGTDRQCRGSLLARLREAPGPVPAPQLAGAWPDPDQRARCLAGLVADGLVETGPSGYGLPGLTPGS